MEKEIRKHYLAEVAKGDVAQLDKLKLRIEDPPRRKHMVPHPPSPLRFGLPDPIFPLAAARWRRGLGRCSG